MYFPVKIKPKRHTLTFPIPGMVSDSANEGQLKFRQIFGQDQSPACALWLRGQKWQWHFLKAPKESWKMREADVPEGMLGNVSDKEERGGEKSLNKTSQRMGWFGGFFLRFCVTKWCWHNTGQLFLPSLAEEFWVSRHWAAPVRRIYTGIQLEKLWLLFFQALSTHIPKERSGKPNSSAPNPNYNLCLNAPNPNYNLYSSTPNPDSNFCLRTPNPDSDLAQSILKAQGSFWQP